MTGCGADGVGEDAGNAAVSGVSFTSPPLSGVFSHQHVDSLKRREGLVPIYVCNEPVPSSQY